MFGWDSHEQNNTLTPILCKRHDQPIAALLADLKRRGMLEDTLVVWGGEFGRTAGSRVGKRGREHNCNGYTMFLAGGGVKGGLTYGESGPPPTEWPVTRCTCTTSTPPSCTCSGLIMKSSPTEPVARTSASPMCTAM